MIYTIQATNLNNYKPNNLLFTGFIFEDETENPEKFTSLYSVNKTYNSIAGRDFPMSGYYKLSIVKLDEETGKSIEVSNKLIEVK